MDFWNFSIAGSILLSPVVAGVLVFRSDARVISKISYALFGLLAAISLISVWKFDESIRLSFLWPVTSEPSGYFNFGLKLHWGNFLWILFSCASLVSHLVYNAEINTDPSARKKSALFLYGVSVSSSLAFLSENFFLSLLFVEMAFFLIFSLLLFSKEEDGTAERSSYFKRAVYLFLSLLSLMGLALVGRAETMTILLLGSLLYFTSTLFSRHTLSNWGSLFLNVHLFSMLFYLNGRVVSEDYSSELLFYFSLIYAALALLFSTFSFLVNRKIDSVSWLLMAAVCFLIFSRLSTSKPDEFIWLSYEAVGLAAVLGMSIQLLFSEKFSSAGWKSINVITLGILLAILTGAIPAIDQSVIKAKPEISARMILLALISFLLATAIGKLISISNEQEKRKQNAETKRVAWALIPFFLVALMFVGVSIHLSQLFGEGPLHQGVFYVISSPHVMIQAAVILLGMALGYFLGRRSTAMGWEYGNKIQMEQIFPGIDSRLVIGAEKFPVSAEALYQSFTRLLSGLSRRILDFTAAVETYIFGEKVYGGIIQQSLKVSGYVKMIHSGETRAYLFWGVLVILVSSAFFVWGNR
jgi:hypothetical protein